MNDKNCLFKSYVNLSSDIDIKFILKFDKENKDEIIKLYDSIDTDKLNKLYKYLHLYKTIKTTNMNLYSVNGAIKLYNNVEEILEEFYKFRLDFYNKRKVLLLNNLQIDIQYYSNQIKFINIVIKNKNIFNLSETEINNLFIKNKIKKYNESYDYLINMTFTQLTNTNLTKIENILKNIKQNYKNILDKTIKDLWLDDLKLIKN